jgi:hypothetical protein
MRAILFAFLRFKRTINKLGLKIRGKTESDIHEQNVVSGKSWEAFCDQLKLAGTVLHQAGTPRDSFQQAEGMRYLSRLTRAGLEAFVEHNDPAFPILQRMVHETVKMGADNPDNYYFNAQISGNFEYRLTGKRNTVNYLGLYTQNGNYASTGGLEPCGALQDSDLVLEDDGTFEVILSKEPRGKNWLKIEDDTSLLMVRQTFYDKTKEEAAEIKIENLDGRQAPDPLTPSMVDEGLKTASMFVAGASLLFARWAKDFQKHTNKLPLFDAATSNAAGGDEQIKYHHSHWKLKNDEALVIEVIPPRCDNWNFQLNNYWMESLDYRYHPVCINKSNADIQPGGMVRIIVANQDPGHSNWLDTCDHMEGTMCWRWYRLAEGVEAVEPACQVVKFVDICAS